VHHDLRSGLRDADVVMMLRLQRERQGRNYLPSLDEYARYFCLTRSALEVARPGAVVMHPGPINRGVEIASDVADGAASLIMEQVTNGVAVRMAILFLFANRGRAAATDAPAVEADAPAERRRKVG